MSKFYDIAQGTPEWMDLRKGKFSASTMKNLFAKETTAAFENEIFRVVFEKLTGEKVESDFKSDYMQRGNDLEAEARERYSLDNFVKVGGGGFYALSEWVGCSPDGLVGEDGLVEIKCPKYSTMVKYLLDRKLPNEYYWQVYSQLYITERAWCDFYAYHPSIKSFSIRIEKDLEVEKEIADKLEYCIEKAKEILEKLR